jgi:hypothetical protein
MSEEKARKKLVSILETSVVKLTFEKVNGDTRVMRATLDVPEYTPDHDSIMERNVCLVWDVEADGWRSFRWDNLISYSLNYEWKKSW